MDRKFKAQVINELGHYVYALTDPRHPNHFRNRIFYVGKGQGNRCFNHAHWVRREGDSPLRENEHKRATIREIQFECGCDPNVEIIAHGFKTETEALQLESILIPLLGDTNKQSGHHSENYWLSANAVDEMYDDPIERADSSALRQNILLVSLNEQTITELQNDRELMAKATLGDWTNGEWSAELVDYIVGVRSKLVVSIFAVNKSSSGQSVFEIIPAKKERQKQRHRYSGKRQPALEAKYCDRAIIEDGREWTKMPSGGAWRFLKAL